MPPTAVTAKSPHLNMPLPQSGKVTAAYPAANTSRQTRFLHLPEELTYYNVVGDRIQYIRYFMALRNPGGLLGFDGQIRSSRSRILAR